jgi:putative ABC transport system substrate-binding protein
MTTRFQALLIALVLALSESFAGAQQSGTIPRIGIFGIDYPSSPVFESFRLGLRELGYIEGQNIIIEPRFSYDTVGRHEQFAGEIVRFKVDVIVALSTPALVAAMGYTKTIPIVMTFISDPVGSGFIASRERPGGNVTGVGGLAEGLGGKWLELLKETVPGISRVGVLVNPGSERMTPDLKAVEIAAHSLRVELQPARARFSREVGGAFTWATRGQADALIVLPGFGFGNDASYIADLALKRRLPAIFWRADFAQAGGLMAYGASGREQSRRAAYVVDKILKGAQPAELPVEPPNKFELVINLKTANEIGIVVPPRVLVWADRVIR